MNLHSDGGDVPIPDSRDREIVDLHARLADAEDTLAALRTGAADALLGETGVLYLNDADKTYITFFSAMNEGGVTLDGAGTILHCNPRFAVMMQLPVDQLRGKSLLSCVVAADRDQVAALLAHQGAGMCKARLAASPASELAVQLSMTLLSADRKHFGCLVVTDLTERMLAEDKLERLVEERTGELRLAASVFENTLDGVMITDTASVILSVNPAFTEITGFSAAEAIGQKASLLRSMRHDANFYAQIWHALATEGRWRGEIWNRRKNGEAYLQRSTINLVAAQSGQVACYVAVFTDVTELWRKDERIAHLAYHDPLTDLPNRTLLMDRLRHALTVAERQGGLLGLLFIDLDGFKAVNDQLGHHVGDELLRDMAQRLRASVRSSDTVARLGGDEFVVLMEHIDSAQECAVLAGKLTACLSWEETKENGTIRVGASIGVAIYPENGTAAATLLQHADAALYDAKAAGKGVFRLYQCTSKIIA
ncbi:MAG: diguanylate cyclase [Rhodocyclaceae bacterium]|nr:diguanylate cyclase [Rhodocyclaceae bacterium]MDZ4216004.1 diguanylate cyclase [Rhodocyclaceae bacterium]